MEQISLAADRSAGLTRQLLAFARRELIQPRLLDIDAVVRRAGEKPASLDPGRETSSSSCGLRRIGSAVFADPRQDRAEGAR